jgi:polyhydroxyalkanoate synthesis regulator phasin
MLDAVRGYLNAASGLTEMTRKRAQDTAHSLLGAGGEQTTAVTAQVSSLADDLIAIAKSNRAAVREMVRAEVEVVVARLGLVPASELASAQLKIARLEATVAELAGDSAAARTGKRAGGRTPSAPRAGARPKRSAVRAAAGTASTSAPASPATKAPGKKASAKKASAKKAGTKKASADASPLPESSVGGVAASERPVSAAPTGAAPGNDAPGPGGSVPTAPTGAAPVSEPPAGPPPAAEPTS